MSFRVYLYACVGRVLPGPRATTLRAGAPLLRLVSNVRREPPWRPFSGPREGPERPFRGPFWGARWHGGFVATNP
eukprot:scaffold238_cov532-Prasinococcus_capsulatus_cf.AAC.6